ncbi:MAG: hypothetical protein HY904_02735 [Deltaproteobacteria bacterium]|nr:hypothetical protein [Deltaproteobacteria bacterium]
MRVIPHVVLAAALGAAGTGCHTAAFVCGSDADCDQVHGCDPADRVCRRRCTGACAGGLTCEDGLCRPGSAGAASSSSSSGVAPGTSGATSLATVTSSAPATSTVLTSSTGTSAPAAASSFSSSSSSEGRSSSGTSLPTATSQPEVSSSAPGATSGPDVSSSSGRGRSSSFGRASASFTPARSSSAVLASSAAALSSSAAPPAAVNALPDPVGAYVAGSCNRLRLVMVDANDTPATTNAVLSLNLFTYDALGQFFADSDTTCSAPPIAALDVLAGAVEAHVRVVLRTVPSTTLGAMNAFGGPARTATVSVIPSALQVTAPTSLLVGECSGAIRVHLLDNAGQRVAAGSVTVTLDVTEAPSQVELFSSANCTGYPSSTAQALWNTTNGAVFSARGLRDHAENLRISAAGLEQLHALTFDARVQRGTCFLLANSGAVDCPVYRAVRDVNRTMMLFSSRFTDNTPRNSAITCQLANTSTIACRRAGTDGAIAVISWQVFESATGLSVQHLTSGCTSDTGTFITLPTPATASSFLLFSARGGGGTINDDDFRTAELQLPSTVIVRNGRPACIPVSSGGEDYALQVVTWTGASVVSGTLQVPINAGSMGVAATGSAALATWRASGSPTACAAFTEAEPAGNLVTLLRGNSDTGCATAAVDTTWQALSFPAAVTVTAFGLQFSGTSATWPLNSNVDPGSTFVFASGQGYSGQGGGTVAGITSVASDAVATLDVSLSTLTVTRGTGTGAVRFLVQVVCVPP